MEELRKKFHQTFPQSFFLEPSQPDELHKYLRKLGYLGTQESILALEKPGEGNMNCVYRVKTTQRSLIVKQARPWVEKYPQIDAPVSRAEVEAHYLDLISEYDALKDFSPKLLGYDPESFLLAIEDLGMGLDYSYLYQKRKLITGKELRSLIAYLNALHSLAPQESVLHFPANLPMRRLNHEHIFHFPFLEENGFDLDTVQPGLQEASLTYKHDPKLKEQIHKLGERYLGPGTRLLHGDYYPGSWLKVEESVKIIDPEFSFVGPPEWDLAVFMAHMMLSGHSISILNDIKTGYQHFSVLNKALLAGFAGTAILRRLIGIAQLPLECTLEEKKELMAMAKVWIEEGNISALTQ